MDIFIKICLLWLVVINVYAFFRMGWDKRKAENEEGRTSEKHFFKTAIIGGTFGVIVGMRMWRHKTQKWKFQVPVYAILVLQVLFLIAIYYFFFMDSRVEVL